MYIESTSLWQNSGIVSLYASMRLCVYSENSRFNRIQSNQNVVNSITLYVDKSLCMIQLNVVKILKIERQLTFKRKICATNRLQFFKNVKFRLKEPVFMKYYEMVNGHSISAIEITKITISILTIFDVFTNSVLNVV